METIKANALWKQIYSSWFYRLPKANRNSKWQLIDLRRQAKLFASIFPDAFNVNKNNDIN